MTTKKSLVGKHVHIATGTRVHREGRPAVQKRSSTVTVLKQELTNTGKTRILWNSMGYRASTIIS